MATLNQIKLESGTYDIEDAYARNRLEGLSSSWSISYSDTLDSTAEYYENALTGVHKTPAQLGASNCCNASFNSSNASITISGDPSSKYIILIDSYDRTGGHPPRFLYLADMKTGDNIYVTQENVPDRWMSGYTPSVQVDFYAHESKSQVGSYALKTEAAKAGTYTSGGPSSNSTGSTGSASVTTSEAGAHTAAATVSVTYKKSNSSTANGGGETVTGTASVTYKKSAAQTGGAGGHTATVKVTAEGSISGSQTVSAHAHTVTTTSDTAIKTLGTTTVATKPTVSGKVLDLSGGTSVYNSVSATFTALKSVTVNNGGSHTVNGSNFTFTGSEVSGSATIADHTHSISLSDATATGSATVTTTAHSHSITLTDTTASADVSIPIGGHTHTVTSVVAHTHTLNNHTHNTTVSAIS